MSRLTDAITTTTLAPTLNPETDIVIICTLVPVMTNEPIDGSDSALGTTSDKIVSIPV